MPAASKVKRRKRVRKAGQNELDIGPMESDQDQTKDRNQLWLNALTSMSLRGADANERANQPIGGRSGDGEVKVGRLHVAVCDGDLTTIDALLTNGADPNEASAAP